MAKKRIAIFGIKYFPSKGGTSRVVEHLLWELKDHFEFTIYCYKHKDATTYIPGVRVIQYSEIPIKGFGVFLYYLKCCIHLLFSGKYDLIHLHKTDSAFFLPLLNLKYKTITTSHALPYLNEKWSVLGKLYFRISEWLFMNSNGSITAISKPQTEYYFSKFKRKVLYIPNGIQQVGEIDFKLTENTLSENKIAPNYILFAARRLIPLKGCHTLVAALNKINFKGTLVVAADDEQMPAYTKKLKSLSAEIDVKFIGYVSDKELLNSLITQAELFVFPSEIEGMSMMMLEVGSLGTPMICSDIPQNLAVLSPKEVLYFKSKDVQDLANKLTWALEHPREMQDLARHSKSKIENEYLVSAVAEKYVDLYNSID